jgi:hypothetical protein
MNFDIELNSQETNDVYEIQVTENYEGDKWHVVVFEVNQRMKSDLDLEFNHFDTKGFDTPAAMIEYLRELGNFPKE